MKKFKTGIVIMVVASVLLLSGCGSLGNSSDIKANNENTISKQTDDTKTVSKDKLLVEAIEGRWTVLFKCTNNNDTDVYVAIDYAFDGKADSNGLAVLSCVSPGETVTTAAKKYDAPDSLQHYM